MSSLFDTGTPLVVLLGLLGGPLLVRQLQFNAFRRTWAVLPAAGLVLVPALFFPLTAQEGFPLALRISVSLLAGLPGLLLLKAWLRGRDRELLEMYTLLNGLLWLPLLARPLLAPALDLPVGFGGRAAALPLLLMLVLALGFLLTGLQERFRLNRAPGAIEGLPFRLGALLLMLVLWNTVRHLLQGGGLG